MAEEYLHSMYFNPKSPASFLGIDKFYDEIIKEGNKFNLKKADVRRWLESQDVYTKYRPIKRNFNRNKIVLNEIDQVWSADLAVFEKYRSENEGYQYVLFIIDIFSRYLWTFPLKTRQCWEVTNAFSSLLSDRRPKILSTDAGSEFLCKTFKGLLGMRDIVHVITRNETKSNYSERVIQTIKRRLYKYFALTRTHKWIDVLRDFTESYNRTYHSSIKTSPIKVTKVTEKNLQLR